MTPLSGRKTPVKVKQTKSDRNNFQVRFGPTRDCDNPHMVRKKHDRRSPQTTITARSSAGRTVRVSQRSQRSTVMFGTFSLRRLGQLCTFELERGVPSETTRPTHPALPILYGFL